MPAAPVALAHDYLLVMRGAERSFAEIARCWPAAPIYTLLHDPRATDEAFAGREVHTSYLQRLGVRQRGFRRLLPLYPRATEHLLDRPYELVVSSSSAFAHGVRPAPGAVHVCYCYTPFRYVWHERERALQEAPRLARPALGALLTRMRGWDVEASRRVTHYVAISELTRERIRDCYDRDAAIVHPPVEVARFALGAPEDYFLFVGEVVRHKRVELALAAAERAGRRMKVVGTGPELERLRARYGAVADFLGRVGDAELARLYAGALAQVVPNVEEFGIAAVEAQAAGRPVLAVDRGGVRETVLDGETGVLVPPESVDALAEAMREVDFTRFSPQRARENAERFAPEVFRERLRGEVARAVGA